MDFEEWEPMYEAILRDFGFERYRDEECARVLDRLIDSRHVEDILAELEGLLRNKVVAVIGARFEQLSADVDIVIAADSSTSALLTQGRFPDVIVTDLDGELEHLKRANDQGTILVVHAHGDNLDRVQRWVPEFNGKVMGTTQAGPFGSLHNFGGFTDGDRAAFLAEHFHAKRIVLCGFDFSEPVEKEGSDPEVKARKLEWGERLLHELAHKVQIERA